VVSSEKGGYRKSFLGGKSAAPPKSLKANRQNRPVKVWGGETTTVISFYYRLPSCPKKQRALGGCSAFPGRERSCSFSEGPLQATVSTLKKKKSFRGGPEKWNVSNKPVGEGKKRENPSKKLVFYARWQRGEKKKRDFSFQQKNRGGGSTAGNGAEAMRCYDGREGKEKNELIHESGRGEEVVLLKGKEGGRGRKGEGVDSAYEMRHLEGGGATTNCSQREKTIHKVYAKKKGRSR